MSENLPLSGLKIAVTRPHDQAETLAAGIAKLGGTAIRFPLLEITPLLDNPQLLAQLKRLQAFDTTIFISPNAARYGMQALRAANLALDHRQQVFAIGQGTAAVLRKQGVLHARTPESGADSEALLQLDELQHLPGRHVLIFRGEHGRSLLADTLVRRGATVEYAPCYQRKAPQNDIAQLLDAHPSLLTVSSSEALQNLWDIVPREQRNWMQHLPLFTIHSRITVAARTLGWQNVITASGGDPGLLAALARWAIEHKEKHE